MQDIIFNQIFYILWIFINWFLWLASIFYFYQNCLSIILNKMLEKNNFHSNILRFTTTRTYLFHSGWQFVIARIFRNRRKAEKHVRVLPYLSLFLLLPSIRKHSGSHRLVHECTISICTCVCLQCINALEIWMFVRDEIWCKLHWRRIEIVSDVLCAPE